MVGTHDYNLPTTSSGDYEQVHKKNEATSNQNTLQYDYPTVGGSHITAEYDVIVDTNSAVRNDTYSVPTVPNVVVNPSYAVCDAAVINTDEQ